MRARKAYSTAFMVNFDPLYGDWGLERTAYTTISSLQFTDLLPKYCITNECLWALTGTYLPTLLLV